MKIIGLLSILILITTNSFGQNKNDIKMEQRITFMTLGVNDLKTSIDFYENKFGWKRSEMSNDNLILYQLNGIHIALYSREELAKDATIDSTGNGFKGFTISYNVWSEKDVDDLIKSLSDKGVKIVKEPQKVFWGGYSSYVADPDGNLWEIAFNPYLKKE
ncbi:glyoxalase [Prolixibacter bellariivorans]|uniref:Glyoxalase n=1 Tax=Prolixibacter bellariivorans TaxID=314319 RepID=A0A5M4AU02_9BACT|nr:VOC family protein [Prolixibacter bellariivorans]GET31382.1 glyoxalase [Prolixibacter bellariivorans]